MPFCVAGAHIAVVAGRPRFSHLALGRADVVCAYPHTRLIAGAQITPIGCVLSGAFFAWCRWWRTFTAFTSTVVLNKAVQADKFTRRHGLTVAGFTIGAGAYPAIIRAEAG